MAGSQTRTRAVVSSCREHRAVAAERDAVDVDVVAVPGPHRVAGRCVADVDQARPSPGPLSRRCRLPGSSPAIHPRRAHSTLSATRSRRGAAPTRPREATEPSLDRVSSTAASASRMLRSGSSSRLASDAVASFASGRRSALLLRLASLVDGEEAADQSDDEGDADGGELDAEPAVGPRLAGDVFGSLRSSRSRAARLAPRNSRSGLRKRVALAVREVDGDLQARSPVERPLVAVEFDPARRRLAQLAAHGDRPRSSSIQRPTGAATRAAAPRGPARPSAPASADGGRGSAAAPPPTDRPWRGSTTPDSSVRLARRRVGSPRGRRRRAVRTGGGRRHARRPRGSGTTSRPGRRSPRRRRPAPGRQARVRLRLRSARRARTGRTAATAVRPARRRPR